MESIVLGWFTITNRHYYSTLKEYVVPKLDPIAQNHIFEVRVYIILLHLNLINDNRVLKSSIDPEPELAPELAPELVPELALEPVLELEPVPLQREQLCKSSMWDSIDRCASKELRCGCDCKPVGTKDRRK